ncbi:NAD(P)H-hydrate epimerase [uncultured Tessaracoccus sp.]|uniref:NAD(P)H-hydrate epimerase n=1 Tax=uncultured Tessaracoccus sp. TaxID=905023 RepID=UPI0025E67C08|nr:NAD(P)H-hydrate epimerase [uncultured Tessaracoccus sp.]
MRPVITADDMRAAEQAVWDAAPDTDLMARAAHAVAEQARRFGPRPVLVVAGPGNNGGDGLFAGAELAGERAVAFWLPAGRGHDEGLAAARDAGADELDARAALELLADDPLVVDAFTGLGARPGLPADVALFAEAAHELDVPVLAVDLPSGLAADGGAAEETFHATRTVTFAARKPCHVLQPAASRCGAVHVADIGVDQPPTRLHQAEPADVARRWPTPGPTSDKYARGVVLLDTGSARYPGAALLGIAGALHAGAGMVRYAGPAPAEVVSPRYPSVVLGSGRAQAAVIGSGWGEPDAVRVDAIAALGVPVVADAEALRTLPARRLERWLLTPHAGELATLLDVRRADVEAEPLVAAREAAATTGAAVLLKGATQVVATPDGRARIAVPGPAWTATAGSGDVLAGICGTLLAAGLEPWEAGVLGASIQALTAADHPGPFPPDRLAEHLPTTIAALLARTA